MVLAGFSHKADKVAWDRYSRFIFKSVKAIKRENDANYEALGNHRNIAGLIYCKECSCYYVDRGANSVSLAKFQADDFSRCADHVGYKCCEIDLRNQEW